MTEPSESRPETEAARTERVHVLLGRWVRHTHTPVRPGPLVISLPAVELTVVAEVEAAGPGPGTRFGRVVLVTSDGAAGDVVDPLVLAQAFDAELAARAGRPEPLCGPGEAPVAVAGPVAVRDPVVPDRAGPWRLRPVRPHGTDLRTLAGWMRRPHVRRFFGQPWPDALWAAELSRHGAGSGSAAVFATGADGSAPVAFLEIYRPVRHRLAGVFPVTPDDVGVHVCVGDTGRGTGPALLAALGRALLDADPGCPRVLAEPDSRNDAALAAFTRAGFRERARIALPHKHATVVTLER